MFSLDVLLSLLILCQIIFISFIHTKDTQAAFLLFGEQEAVLQESN